MDTSKFSQFTNLYSVPKTLRFALEPLPQTEVLLKDLVEKDKKRARDYQQIKPILDKLHEDFIRESLKKSNNIDFSEYFSIFNNLLDLRTQKQREVDSNEKLKIEKYIRQEEERKRKIEEKLRKEICKLYEETARDWTKKYVDKKGKSLFKEKSYKILTEASILKVLEEIYKEDEEKVSIIKNFHGFFTYFTGFNLNRENYYSDKDKSTSISNRIVNENLPKFCQNIIKYSKFKEIFENDDELKAYSNIFDINYYNKTLTQEDIDKYNEIIGKFNSFINQYNQKNKDKTRIQLFNVLYKQIGFQKKRDESIFEINDLGDTLKKFIYQSSKVKDKILNLVQIINYTDDLDGIYVNKRSIPELSRMILTSWDVLGRKLSASNGVISDEETADLKVKDNISLKEIIDSFESDNDSFDSNKELFREEFQETNGNNLFLSAITKALNNKIDKFMTAKDELERTLSKEGTRNSKSIMNDKSNEASLNDVSYFNSVVKSFCDSAIDLMHFVKLFSVKNPPENINTEFYNLHREILEDPDYPVFKWYDAIRNYLTKKPYSLDKIKLNFEKGNLLAGWPDSPEGNTQYYGFIFRENSDYYLGISHNTRLFDKKKYPQAYYEDGEMQKMVFKQISAKTIYGSLYRGRYGSKYADDKEKLSDAKLVKRIKRLLKTKKNEFPEFNKIIETRFDTATDLARAISSGKFSSLSFVKVSKKYVQECTLDKEKPLYLFKITNKDLSKKNKISKDNLHTLYWKALFENKDSNIKLDGNAEVFFRPMSMHGNTDVVITKKNKKTIAHALRHARFRKDRYLFHVPIKLNFESTEDKRVTDKVRELIRKSEGRINVIGIDRGEKHLAYYSVIDPDGNILEQGSLNKDLLGNDYAEILEKIAQERQKARKNWEEIVKIKDIKEGYISQVVKRIVDLAIKYESLVVFEDLSAAFKRGRQKIESSVYQKLELAIAKKLSFYVSKESKENEIGSVSKALQLVPPVNNYGDIKGKQFGIILYTRANYTSQTDPLTGWVKSIYLKKGSEEYIKNQILSAFSDIYFDGKDYVFVYTDANNKEWKLYSGIYGVPLDRYVNRKGKYQNEWVTVKENPVEILDKVFSKFDKNKSLYDQIKNGVELTKSGSDYTAYESLRFAIDLIQQIRNTGTESQDDDFILSPVRDENGVHFDSRKAKENMPNCGDANGAYNIARKGIVMCRRILEKDKPDLVIRDLEWQKIASNWGKDFNRQKWTM